MTVAAVVGAADTPHVGARLVSDTASLEPGSTVRVGVLFEMEPGWHVYWKNPGDSGLATEVLLEPPVGFESMDRADNKEFHDSNGLPQPILVDQDGIVGHLYGAATTPHMFVIDPSGTIVYEGAIEDDPRGSKSGGATNYVAAALDETLSGASVSTRETKPYGCSVKYKN
jgi:hypothetical protein